MDSNDGLSVTTIAISQEGSKPILLVSLDLSYPFSCVVKDVKAAIVEATEGAVSADHIMTTATNTIGSIDISSYDTDIILKDENDESSDNDSTQDGTDDSASGEDDGKDTEISKDATYDLHNADGTVAGKITGKQLYDNIAQWYDRFIDQVALSAVNALEDRSEANMSKGSIDASEATDGVVFNANRHAIRTTQDGEQFVYSDNSTSPAYDAEAGTTPISKVKDALSLIQFSFAGEGKVPVVLANWSGMAKLNPDRDNNTYYSVTSDYVNCFRNDLIGYCVGFYPGACSSISTTSRISSEISWMFKGTGDKNGDGICTGKSFPAMYTAMLSQM